MGFGRSDDGGDHLLGLDRFGQMDFESGFQCSLAGLKYVYDLVSHPLAVLWMNDR